jgi:hypothetical protein
MKRTIYVLFALLALAFLGSCTRGSVGIFASIEQEVKTQKSNLSETSAITGVAQTDNHYFASLGNIARRSIGGSDWAGVGNPPGIESPISVALVQLGPPGSREYYAAFNSQEGSDYGLFQLTIDSSGTVSWTELDLVYDDTNTVKEIAALVAVNTDPTSDQYPDKLFASVRTVFENGEPLFTLLENPAGIGGAETPILERTDNLYDGAVDAATGNYWFVGSKGGIFRYDGVTIPVSRLSGGDAGYPTDSGGTAGKSFAGVYSADTGLLGGTGSAVGLFVSDTNGRIWYTNDQGTNWQMSDLSGRAFTDMIWVPSAGNNGAGALLVGTKPVIQQGISDQGYYEVELTLDGSDNVTFDGLETPDSSSYDTSDLQDATVRTFYLPDDGASKSTNQVFVLTGGIGLWNVIYDTAGIPDVRWE